MRVSTCSIKELRPRLAFFFLVEPSTSKGKHTIATAKAPFSLAAFATNGAAPVPVPPPIPAVTNTRSPLTTSLMTS